MVTWGRETNEKRYISFPTKTVAIKHKRVVVYNRGPLIKGSHDPSSQSSHDPSSQSSHDSSSQDPVILREKLKCYLALYSEHSPLYLFDSFWKFFDLT